MGRRMGLYNEIASNHLNNTKKKRLYLKGATFLPVELREHDIQLTMASKVASQRLLHGLRARRGVQILDRLGLRALNLCAGCEFKYCTKCEMLLIAYIYSNNSSVQTQQQSYSTKSLCIRIPVFFQSFGDSVPAHFQFDCAFVVHAPVKQALELLQ
ncbi:Uncharacterized protein Fot_22252 [Forsythia ovata]|uniref:Uncharacterized protein n=1 Tax=Forsythia ovata TaxID=205694 RepID=A0ABD1UX59_9LAMI